ncbi:D-cysteine desulfhydrase family protein [Ningiella sp. W23]|uniref:D-cysteine desulfhydrase family protein n=1 Tax=Ningiella sp. W23 TaxID=3023715 RepID=UPI00375822B5
MKTSFIGNFELPSKVSLAALPTPLEPLLQFADCINAANKLWIKRDDLTGLAMGGNKTRKLEYSLADALAQNADVVITCGGLQSNHVRQTAAACAKLGIECHAVLTKPFSSKSFSPDTSYHSNGNILLNQILDAQLHYFDSAHSGGQTLDDSINTLERSLIKKGKRAYTIPLGASDGIGAMGYVECASELLVQFEAQGANVSHIVLTTGSAGTQAGLIFGLRALGSQIKITGISVIHPSDVMVKKIQNILNQIQLLLPSCETNISLEDIVVCDQFINQGYGVPDKAANQSLKLMAQTQGILLDPVYTAKAALGLQSLLSNNYFVDDQDIVLMHTGGASALFAYQDELSKVSCEKK